MSLRLRLLAVIGLSLTLLWGAVAIWMLVDMRRELYSTLDERLAASAQMVAGVVSQWPLPPVSGPSNASALDVVARDGVACEVSLMRGEVVSPVMARTADSPDLNEAPAGYGTREFGGKPWRVYVLQRNGLRIATADRLDLRTALWRDAALSAGIPFAVALLGSLGVLWLGIGRGLAPLERLRTALARRRPDDPLPLPEGHVARELRPLVSTIRALLDRTRGAIERERRFTDDAAHELRTPLTAIKTHLQVAQLAAQRPDAAGTLAGSLSCAEEAVQRLQATLEQLLLLARLDERGLPSDAAVCTDVRSAAQRAIDDACGAASPNGRVVLSDAMTDLPLCVPVAEPLLIAALRNLLDNALRHAPADTPVELRLRPAGVGRVCMRVLDDGPGLTDEECEQAPRRFWRRGGSTQGSGLGLSIVHAIAERHGGGLTLNRRGPSGGLDVMLMLPSIPAREVGAGTGQTTSRP